MLTNQLECGKIYMCYFLELVLGYFFAREGSCCGYFTVRFLFTAVRNEHEIYAPLDEKRGRKLGA